MTQKQLEHQVARITGDPLMIVIRLGFHVTSRQPFGLEPEDVQLVLDCPFCGHPVSYPGQASDRSETLAECNRCDVSFGFDPDEVYTIDAEQRIGATSKENQPYKYHRATRSRRDLADGNQRVRA
jgi:hypothetical protein